MVMDAVIAQIPIFWHMLGINEGHFIRAQHMGVLMYTMDIICPILKIILEI